MSDKKIKVLMAVPCWGTAPPEACEYRTEMGFYLGRQSADPAWPYEFGLGIVSDFMVQFSREQICRRAVDDNFDYVCMIDDDMLGPVDLWPRLLAHRVDIVSPLAFTRTKPHKPVVFAQRGGKDNHHVANYPKDTLFECDALGFGAVCIKVDVLRQLPRPWFFQMSGSNGTGEDIFFCLQAKKLVGARVWCDSATKLLHLGPRTYIGEADYEAQNPDILDLRERVGDWSMDKRNEGLQA